MNFLRFVIVLVITTACAGLFGAAVGGLVGYAAPNFLTVVFGVEKHNVHEDAEAYSDRSTQVRTQVGLDPQRSDGMAGAGAAMGGATGLMAGAVIGLVLGVLDQFILLARNIWLNRTERNRPAGAAVQPSLPR